MTITMIPREGVAITDKALAAIKDPSKATDPKKSQVTTPNTINGLNTPSHDCSYKDNINRTKVIIHVSKWNRDVVYYVDDNGVYYDESGAVCEKYAIGCTMEDVDQAVEDAFSTGGPITVNVDFYTCYSMIGDKFTEEQWRTIYVRDYNNGNPLSDAEWKIIWDGCK